MWFDIAINVLLLAMILYLWPHRERRFEKVLIAIVGALVGSLVGRLLVNPVGVGHLAFVVGGATAFACIDWARKSMRSTIP